MADPENVYELAHSLLDAVLAAYTADGVAPPERQVVSGVPIVDDCEQIAVAADRVYIGEPGRAESPVPVTHGIHRVAQFTVRVTRCLVAVPDGTDMESVAPSVAALDEDARVILTDAFVVHRGIVRAHFDGGLLRGICEAVSVGPATFYASGGVGGFDMTVACELS